MLRCCAARASILALLPLTLLGLGACASKASCPDGGCADAGVCLTDTECRGGEICEQGVCVPARSGPCTSDAECPGGRRCELLTGACVDTSGCRSDTECPSGQRCDRSTGECTSDPGCRRDVECAPPATICANGQCVDGCTVRGCAGSETCDSSSGRCVPPGGCTEDAACDPPRSICTGGTCVPGCGIDPCPDGWNCNFTTGRCVTTGACTTDAECGPPAQICYAGRCVAGCTSGSCGAGSTCDPGTGRCSGATGCVTDTNCSPPATICEGGACVPGCTSTGCTSGTCNTGTGRCASGSGCTSDAQCADPFPICQGGTCVSAGGGCTQTGCPSGQLCDPYREQCEPRGTLPLGSTCTRHEECADDYCIVLGDGVGRCTRACSATHQCPLDFVCYALPPPGTSFCIHESLIGKDYGPSPPGAFCSATSNTCHSGMCLTLTGVCTDSCQHDRDCRTGEACTLLIGDFDGNGVDEVRTICMERGLGGTTGDACTANSQCMRGNCMGTPPGSVCGDPCCTSNDCPWGTTCQPVQRAGAEGLFRACGAATPTGDAPVGSPCNRADHTPCRSGWCFEDKQGAPPYCTDTCCTDADCPSGFRCVSELFDVNNDGTYDVSQPLCERR